MIDDLLALLDLGTDLGVLSYDESVIRNAHREVAAFDGAALAADAHRLRAIVDRLRVSSATAVDDVWSGGAGRAAANASAAASARIGDAAAELSGLTAAVEAAATAVAEVTARYRQAMAAVGHPVIAGVDADAIPASVATGAVSRDDVRTDLIGRIEYATAAGRTAGAALVDIARTAVGAAGSDGELVIAGLR